MPPGRGDGVATGRWKRGVLEWLGVSSDGEVLPAADEEECTVEDDDDEEEEEEAAEEEAEEEDELEAAGLTTASNSCVPFCKNHGPCRPVSQPAGTMPGQPS